MDRTKISKNLIALRGEKSREEVAFSIGISASALSMYETGQRIPRDEIKLKLAEYYGVDVQSIFLSNRYTKCEQNGGNSLRQSRKDSNNVQVSIKRRL